MKTIDLSKTVYDLSRQYPEFIPIMTELGFKEMQNSMNLQAMGRLVSPIEGSKRHNVPIEDMVKKFEENGFHVVGIKK